MLVRQRELEYDQVKTQIQQRVMSRPLLVETYNYSAQVPLDIEDEAAMAQYYASQDYEPEEENQQSGGIDIADGEIGETAHFELQKEIIGE